MKFSESPLEQAYISLLEAQGYHHEKGEEIVRGKEEVLIKVNLVLKGKIAASMLGFLNIT